MRISTILRARKSKDGSAKRAPPAERREPENTMNAYAIQTIVGRISHVGQFTYDNAFHTYSTIEVETANGRVDLSKVLAPNALDRAIEPGRDAAMAVIHGDGKKVQTAVIGIYNAEARRTFSDDQMHALRSHAFKQAVLLSVTAVIWLPVAFLLFVVPGLLGLMLLWKAWAAVSRLPTAEDVQRVVGALPSQGAHLSQVSEAG